MTGAEGYEPATVQGHNHEAAADAQAEQQLNKQQNQQLDEAAVWHQDMLPDPYPAAVLVLAGNILAAAIATMVSAVGCPLLYLPEPRKQVCQVEGWRLAVMQDTDER